ncbi:MAG: tRNA(Ile)-lysidine synthase [Glaciecola sp.]|jgi:tRNA(Ile)-lysidine synthase
MSMTSQLVKSIQSCVPPHCKSVAIALSGGVDSVVMLHACLALRAQTQSSFTVNAIHIHHGLSPNADDWLFFCQQLCEQFTLSFQCEIPFQYSKVNVQPAPRKSLEALARDARYSAIDQLAPADSVVLLGQHEDDQAETVLLQLKRGSGPKGLSGMAERFTKTSSVQYARPWINTGIGKQEILAYAREYELTWVEDESNQDTSFDRNFLRNEVMPVLKKKWPQINTTIIRSALLCASQNQLIETFAMEALQKIENEEAALSLSGLSTLPDKLLSEVIRLWSAQQTGFSVSAAQLYEIQKLRTAKADQVGYVQVDSWQCRSFNQYLYWVALSDIANDPALAYSVQIELDNNIEYVNVTYGNLHRKVCLYANRPTKTIKAWMKESGVRPWRRMAMPILCLNEQVIALQLGDKLIFSAQFQARSANTDAIQKLIQQV